MLQLQPTKWPSYGNNGTSSTCNTEDAGDVSSIPVPGRSPGGGNAYPLQYSCLENSMDREAWRVSVHRVTKSWTWLKWLSTHTHTRKPCLILSHALTLCLWKIVIFYLGFIFQRNFSKRHIFFFFIRKKKHENIYPEISLCAVQLYPGQKGYTPTSDVQSTWAKSLRLSSHLDIAQSIYEQTLKTTLKSTLHLKWTLRGPMHRLPWTLSKCGLIAW